MGYIRIQNLSKRFRLYHDPAGRLKEILWRGRRSYHRDFPALTEISMEVGAGKTVGVIGRNGSGKSTLLQIVAGILTPTSGSVEIEGRVSAILELGSGFDPDFTGRENVFLNGAILGFSQDEIQERFPDIAAFADIGDFIDQPVKFYSSGMFVRLAFAIAINVNPEILLVDEALAVGDVAFQHRCMSRIREIQNQGKTILFVSHDIAAVSKLCSEAILLDKGRMICQGKPEEVIHEYNRIIWNAEPLEERAAMEQADSPIRRSPEFRAVDFQEIKSCDGRFGNRTGEVVGFLLTDGSGRPREIFQGGMDVFLVLAVKCHKRVDLPMAGFIMKDLLGNNLIAINSDSEKCYLSPCPEGSLLTVTFSFKIPDLKAGGYSISAGFGNGTFASHTAYDWIENIVVFTIESKKECHGLINTPVSIAQKFL
jgi:ABC-type polysaccharide/polyol phosphate transport system ATPase subunit